MPCGLSGDAATRVTTKRTQCPPFGSTTRTCPPAFAEAKLQLRAGRSRSRSRSTSRVGSRRSVIALSYHTKATQAREAVGGPPFLGAHDPREPQRAVGDRAGGDTVGLCGVALDHDHLVERIGQQPGLADREARQARVADIGDVARLVALVERDQAGRQAAIGEGAMDAPETGTGAVLEQRFGAEITGPRCCIVGPRRSVSSR